MGIDSQLLLASLLRLRPLCTNKIHGRTFYPNEMDAKAPLEVHDEEVPTSLLEARRPSLHLREVVETYMVSKKSGLDGSIHKALNTNDPRVRLDQRKHEWVETEVEEVSLYEIPRMARRGLTNRFKGKHCTKTLRGTRKGSSLLSKTTKGKRNQNIG